MSQLYAFEPAAIGATGLEPSSVAVVAAANTPVNGTLPPQGTAQGMQMLIANTTANWITANLGPAGITNASASLGIPVPPGGIVIVTVEPSWTNYSVNSVVGGAGNVMFTRGEGK